MLSGLESEEGSPDPDIWKFLPDMEESTDDSMDGNGSRSLSRLR